MKKMTHMLLALMILGTYSVFHTAQAADDANCVSQNNGARDAAPIPKDESKKDAASGKTGTQQ